MDEPPPGIFCKCMTANHGVEITVSDNGKMLPFLDGKEMEGTWNGKKHGNRALQKLAFLD